MCTSPFVPPQGILGRWPSAYGTVLPVPVPYYVRMNRMSESQGRFDKAERTYQYQLYYRIHRYIRTNTSSSAFVSIRSAATYLRTGTYLSRSAPTRQRRTVPHFGGKSYVEEISHARTWHHHNLHTIRTYRTYCAYWRSSSAFCAMLNSKVLF